MTPTPEQFKILAGLCVFCAFLVFQKLMTMLSDGGVVSSDTDSGRTVVVMENENPVEFRILVAFHALVLLALLAAAAIAFLDPDLFMKLLSLLRG